MNHIILIETDNSFVTVFSNKLEELGLHEQYNSIVVDPTNLGFKEIEDVIQATIKEVDSILNQEGVNVQIVLVDIMIFTDRKDKLGIEIAEKIKESYPSLSVANMTYHFTEKEMPTIYSEAVMAKNDGVFPKSFFTKSLSRNSMLTFHQKMIDKVIESDNYSEIVRMSENSNEIELSEEEKRICLEIKKRWNDGLQHKMKPMIGEINGSANWYDQLGIPLNRNFDSSYWDLESISDNRLIIKDSIEINKNYNGLDFSYDRSSNLWNIGDHLILKLNKKFEKAIDLDRAGRLFLLHETLHYSRHGIDKHLASNVGGFPKTIEDADYQADVYAILHDCKYSQLFENEHYNDIKSFVINCIGVVINTIWSFNDNGTDLRVIQIRRMNRFLIWYWQLIRVQSSNDEEEVIKILTEKPVIELSGLKIFSERNRTYFDLRMNNNTKLELCGLIDNKIKRATTSNIEHLVGGFVKRDSKMIIEAIEMFNTLFTK